MVRLRFFNLQPPTSVEIVAQAFVFDAEQVCRLPARETVAKHQSNVWSVGAEHYLRLEVTHAVNLHFREAGQTAERHGPFVHFSAVDGVLIADGRALAMLKKGGWASLADGRLWREFEVMG